MKGPLPGFLHYAFLLPGLSQYEKYGTLSRALRRSLSIQHSAGPPEGFSTDGGVQPKNLHRGKLVWDCPRVASDIRDKLEADQSRPLLARKGWAQKLAGIQDHANGAAI